MGTQLQAAGLPTGQLPELWNLTEPEKVTAVHRRYVEAGSRILYTNTFGVNGLKAARYGHSVSELVEAGVRCARAADRGEGIRVALDIGPLGQILEPLGTLRFEEAYALFREIVVAGRDAGADLIVIETMSDLYEVKAALLAAKENSSLPVWTTMTFEASGRSFVGTTVSAMGLTLSGLGADAIGFNCSLGPKELLPLVCELRRWTDLPLILKPNAGLPDPATGEYRLSAEAFAEELLPALREGVAYLGGCCGTTPEFIRVLRERLAVPGLRVDQAPISNEKPPRSDGVCSATGTAVFDGVRVIGERINPTGKKRFQQALREQDIDYIVARGIEQQDAGADILDVNVGLPGIDEAEMMKRTVKALQAVIDLPLQIDSSNPEAIEAGLRAVNGKAIVNSVNGKEESLRAILPLCRKYGAKVVGLCMDENGIPETWEARAAIAERILNAALAIGMPKEDVLIDCLTLTVSVQQEQAGETLRALRYVRETLGLRTVLGVSNISFGLPARENITVSFLTQALAAGLDLPIVNPNQPAVMDAIAAYRVLAGEDSDSEAYIRRFASREKPASTEKIAGSPAKASGISLTDCILRGLKGETARLTEEALETRGEMAVIDELLIPALDRVGMLYEKQEIFLPQLINAANAACGGFEVIRRRLAQSGSRSVSKGKILLATVYGDIHDIGKNIVRTVLENYGYTVIDLGRDVPAEVVVETAVREDIRLVGLSALMTTTVSSMADTIAALRRSGHDCRIMVGGAVLTPEYALEIGADYYAKDAKQSADIAREVLG
ncbi:MAG: homocysteine S-methyltransferase family protein [Oscillospiraceae bacterium]|nr:homocysteine S-methyltransferase family protein [Oscillospiraceae bacterium]